MNRLIAFGILCSCLITSSVFAQQKQAEKYVKDLASPDFHGRGYTHRADSLAADYILQRFKSFGLAAINDNYYQYFDLDINTFPGKIVLTIGDDALEAGKDFIVDPHSGSAEGEMHLLRLDSSNINDYQRLISLNAMSLREGKLAVVIDSRAEKDNPDSLMKYQSLKYGLASVVPVFYINDDKYTWSTGGSHTAFPIIEINARYLDSVSSVYLSVKNEFIENYTTQNVIAYVPAQKKCKRKKCYKVITAHYDHLGHMGKDAYIPGANDNASGTAMLLTLAQYYAENPPKDFNLVFMAFGAEEAGLLGSKYYTEHPLFPLKDIEFLLNLDLQGTGEEGITVVNATLHPKAFTKILEINKANDYLVKVKKRGEAKNSDHYYFTKAGVPAFFIYTMGGISAYHDINDRSETLPLTEFNDLHKLYIEFLNTVK